MNLETIAKTYGMVDYMDQTTGNIYELSKAFDDGEDMLLVPVIAPFGDNVLVGYARMKKQEVIDMAVNIRKAKEKYVNCTSCGAKQANFYDVGIGPSNHKVVVTLCDGCMHSLLQKLIIVGRDKL